MHECFDVIVKGRTLQVVGYGDGAISIHFYVFEEILAMNQVKA